MDERSLREKEIQESAVRTGTGAPDWMLLPEDPFESRDK